MSYENIIKISELDLKLVGNPQITFFKSVYRRHTPFFKGIYSFSKDENVLGAGVLTKKISYGTFDLICDIFIEHKIRDLVPSEKIYANIGNSIINEIKLNVGQTTVFNTFGLYMEARSELDYPYIPSMLSGSSVPPILNEINGSLSCNTGNIYNISTFAGGVSGSSTNASKTDTFYTYPNFYFCRDYGNSFPICALNNTNTNLEITYRDKSAFTNSSHAKLDSTVHIEYVNLSSDERLRFINNTEEYLYYNISQIPVSQQVSTDFNNLPLRQIFFVGNDCLSASETVTLSTPTSISDIINEIKISVDSPNNMITDSEKLSIFTKRNLYKLYKGYGRDLVTTSDGKSHGYLDSVGVYSFCLDTSNTPSGHCSNNINLIINVGKKPTKKLYMYLEQINFYRIMGGQLSTVYVNG